MFMCLCDLVDSCEFGEMKVSEHNVRFLRKSIEYCSKLACRDQNYAFRAEAVIFP